MFFLGILSIQCKIRSDRPTETRRSTGQSRSVCWQSLVGLLSIKKYSRKMCDRCQRYRPSSFLSKSNATEVLLLFMINTSFILFVQC